MIKPNKNQPDIKTNITTDITIVGGGLVGLAAALALSKTGQSITLLESSVVKNNTHPSYDDRTLVVNKASICFWKNIGIWQDISNNITAIKKVHVSNKGHFGTVIFKAEDFNTDVLAVIVEAKKLGIKLMAKAQQDKNICIICPADVTGFNPEKDHIDITFKHENKQRSIRSKLMLAADGVQSSIRKKLNLETQIKSYDKTAIICNITPELKHNNCAYERLTASGPTALLPFVNNRCGFVWTVDKDEAEEILKLPDHNFLQQAQEQFGYRLGKFLKAGKRSSYPLYLVKVPRQVKSRIILLGNAAHTMSPVSAQGLNLAIRDVAMLTQVMNTSLLKGSDIGSNKTLNLYQKQIEYDQNQTMKYTDDLMSWFKIEQPLISGLRSAGFIALDQMTFMKSKLYSSASGYRGNTAKLLRSI